eukprot:SAG11_NODE_10945_length_794_cov_1.243165_2_plen_31_part_01
MCGWAMVVLVQAEAELPAMEVSALPCVPPCQ